jgi:signal transduction histidine kinase
MLLDIFVLIISIASWILSYIAYLYYKEQMGLPEIWYHQLVLLFGIGILNSIIIYYVKNKNIDLILFAIKVILFFFICFPVGKFILIGAIMITGIIVEAVFHFKLKTNILLLAFVVLMAYYVSRNKHFVWNFYTTPSDWAHLYIFSVYCIFIFCTFSMIKLFYLRATAYLDEIKRQNIMILVLEETNKNYQEVAIHSSEKSKTEERKRIARDLHDIIGFSMTTIKIMVEVAITMLPKKYQELHQLFQELKTQTSTGFDEMIHVVRSMYRMPQQHKSGMAAIQNLVNSFMSATKTKVRLEFSNMPNSCGDDLDHIIYHIIQEGIINSFRHGRADYIRISFWKDHESIKINIFDNGSGPTIKNSLNQGIGLDGIKDRVIGVGGSFNSCNVIGGYEVIAILPWNEGADDEY